MATRNAAADFKPGDILAETKSENFARVDAKELPALLVPLASSKCCQLRSIVR
jgi:hypothetical protein